MITWKKFGLRKVRYQKIKDELQLERLMSNVFSEKYTDGQRAKLADKLVEHARAS